MWKVLGAILIVGTALAAIKLAFVLLFLAGLIFRPKETLGVLAVGAFLALWSYSLAAGFIATGLIVLLTIYGAAKQQPKVNEQPPPD